jgi:hypothetical protein
MPECRSELLLQGFNAETGEAIAASSTQRRSFERSFDALQTPFPDVALNTTPAASSVAIVVVNAVSLR